MSALALLQPSSDDSSRRCVQARCVLDWSNLPNFGLDFNNVGVDNTEAALDEETTEEVLEKADDLD